MWNRICKLHIPPKVRNFVWRACSDILPTRTNLCRGKVPLDPVCGICQKQNETVAHALWSCPMARNVWALVAGKLQKSEAEDICVLVRELMAVLSIKELEVWAIVSWSIWNARNRCLFDKKTSSTLRDPERCDNPVTRLPVTLSMTAYNGETTPTEMSWSLDKYFKPKLCLLRAGCTGWSDWIGCTGWSDGASGTRLGSRVIGWSGIACGEEMGKSGM
nr:hypothetical protein CFP56_29283 [Quercus suber]